MVEIKVQSTAELFEQMRAVARGEMLTPTPADAAVLSTAQIVPLSAEDQHAFADAILNPPALAPAMERAIELHRTLITASR